MNNLNTTDMAEVGNCFIESFKFCLGNYTVEGQLSITKFAATLVLDNKPYLMATTEGVLHYSKLVFTNDGNRDFIFSLHYVFFSRFGYADNDIDGLISNLSRGMSLNNQNSIMPEVLINRLSSEQNAYTILKNNKWLVIIALMQLFITIDKKD